MVSGVKTAPGPRRICGRSISRWSMPTAGWCRSRRYKGRLARPSRQTKRRTTPGRTTRAGTSMPRCKGAFPLRRPQVSHWRKSRCPAIRRRRPRRPIGMWRPKRLSTVLSALATTLFTLPVSTVRYFFYRYFTKVNLPLSHGFVEYIAIKNSTEIIVFFTYYFVKIENQRN